VSKLDILKTGIPELREKLDFGEFHPALAGNYVDVWLNLSKDFQKEITAHQEANEVYYDRRDTLLEALERDDLPPGKREEYEAELEERMTEYNERTWRIYARLWDCEPEEVAALAREAEELFFWLVSETWKRIGDYRAGRKKAPTGSSSG
jgi:hypothetical protein